MLLERLNIDDIVKLWNLFIIYFYFSIWIIEYEENKIGNIYYFFLNLLIYIYSVVIWSK